MITEKVQALLDAKVEGSPRARELIGQLDGRCMRVAVRHTPWEISVVAADGHLRLMRTGAPPADVTVSGTPLAMLSMLREDPQAVIRRGDVQLSGDSEAGSRFQELALLLRPELEEGLGRVIGDVPAFGVGSLLRRALSFGRASVATQAANIGEYLAHERQLLVPQAEARQFIDGVDALREDTDRLAARVARLEALEKQP